MSDDERNEEESFPFPMVTWSLLAMIFGWNELVKRADSLGERVFCRMMRNDAHDRYVALGGCIDMSDKEKPVVVLTGYLPSIKLYPRDVELMRKAVANHDAARTVSKKERSVRFRWWAATIALTVWCALATVTAVALFLATCSSLFGCANRVFDVAEPLEEVDSDPSTDSGAGPLDTSSDVAPDRWSNPDVTPHDGARPEVETPDVREAGDASPESSEDSGSAVDSAPPVDSTPPPVDSGFDSRETDACPRWCLYGTLPDGADCAGEGDSVCCSDYCYLGLCAPKTADPNWCGDPCGGYWRPGTPGAKCE